MMRFGCVIVVALCVCTLKADDKIDPTLAKLVKEWRLAKSKADKDLLRAIDSLADKIKMDRSASAEVRNQRIKLMMDQKAAFLKQKELPSYDNLLGTVIAYLDKLDGEGRKLSRHFEASLEKAIGNEKEFEAIANLKQKWQAELPTGSELVGKTDFRGSRRYTTGVTVDFNLQVWSFENNVFTGAIWQDTANFGAKSGWQYEAKREGSQFVLRTTKMLHGAPRQLQFRGYVIGRRIVMTLTHRDGQPLTGDLVSVWKQ